MYAPPLASLWDDIQNNWQHRLLNWKNDDLITWRATVEFVDLADELMQALARHVKDGGQLPFEVTDHLDSLERRAAALRAHLSPSIVIRKPAPFARPNDDSLPY